MIEATLIINGRDHEGQPTYHNTGKHKFMTLPRVGEHVITDVLEDEVKVAPVLKVLHGEDRILLLLGQSKEGGEYLKEAVK